MSKKHIVPTVDTLAQFERCVDAGMPCILNIPFEESELAEMRGEVRAFMAQLDKIWVFMTDTCDTHEVAGADFRAEFENGNNTYNVLEHHLDQSLIDKLYIPDVFASTRRNLFIDVEHNINPISLVASTLYTYATPHVDYGAFGNWMALVSGKKLWMLVAPQDEHLFYSEHTRSWNFDDQYKTQFIHYGMLGPGQLIYSPPVWAHSVITLETAIGYGGQYVGKADLATGRAMSKLLLERGIQSQSYVDLYDIMEAGEKKPGTGRQVNIE